VTLTVEQLEERYAVVQWREPVAISGPGFDGWACRVCIANHGIKANELTTTPFAFEQRGDAVTHIAREHLA
jgi:hypothetical protein